MTVDVNNVQAWLLLAQVAISLGAKSWDAFKSLMVDAGADIDTVAALQPQWDALVSDVRRAAGVSDGTGFSG